ncbi:receptor-type tyrosine-protein phosphatase epsilon-like [Watersipora subatra]|uniref:receptor-type tyrosine-protein phosphatase epsilon-like n=1 Tax=Watersipora subatra TaxID=2589382 RepID=UPI00355C14C0
MLAIQVKYSVTDSNRVTLDMSRGYFTDYINANYIMDYRGTSSFVAAQGPLPGTIEDMWRMIHDTNSSTIVMLTNPVEATKKKCAEYWPMSKTPERFGQFEKSRAVRQFHFTQWPDHGVPTTTGLLSFRQRVKQDTARSQAPVIVHCSAGVGRTGTFIGLDILIDEAHDKSKRVPAVNLMKCVYNMRKQRTKMIQTHDQYQFLYEVLAEALTGGDSLVDCSQFTETLAKWRKATPNGKSVIEKQFDAMNAAAVEVAFSRYSAAISEENVPKSQDSAVLPLDLHRVRISAVANDTDYINAVYIHGYHHRNGFVATQTPLPTTTYDFWNMVITTESPVVVFFNDTKNKQYWPTDGLTIQSGIFIIECLKASNPCDWYKEVEICCTMGSVRISSLTCSSVSWHKLLEHPRN